MAREKLPQCNSGLHFTRAYRPRSSAFNGDYVRLDLAVDSAPAEPPGDGFRRDIGCFAEPRGIAGLDLVP